MAGKKISFSETDEHFYACKYMYNIYKQVPSTLKYIFETNLKLILSSFTRLILQSLQISSDMIS